MTRRPPLDARLAWVVTAAAVAVFVARAWPALATVVDDAWISARYARNLALGNGLVYNAGEPPVEGYTNLLFVVLSGGLYKLGVDMHAAMVGLGLLFAILGLFAATALTRAMNDRPSAWDAVPAVLLAVMPHYAVVATNGIESSMFVCGVMGASAAALGAEGRWRWPAGLVVGLLSAVRPEGIAVGAALVGWDLMRHRGAWGRTSSWPLAVGLAAVAGPVWFGRYLYFGAWVPNTFEAKGHKAVLDQIDFNITYLRPEWPFWASVAAVFALGAVLPPWNDRKLVVTLTGLGLIAVAFSVDMWMPGGRLLLPAVSLGLCLAGTSFARLGDLAPAPAAALVAILSGPLLFGPLPKVVYDYDKRHTALPGNGAQLAGEFIAAHAPPGAILATRDAGVLAYAVGPDVDMLEIHPRALTQPHVDRADLDVAALIPTNPEFFATTVQREKQPASKYATDKLVFKRLDVPYDYLGRVYQHHHRYYDIYVRSDLDFPPLPDEIVLNRAGPLPKPKKKPALVPPG